MSNNIFSIRFIQTTVYAVVSTNESIIRINDLNPEIVCANNHNYLKVIMIEREEWKHLNEIDVTVQLGGLIQTFKLKKVKIEKKYKLVAMTLFKDDEALIPAYINYYRELGVEHFYLYHNKPMSHNLPQYEDVTYIEWLFPYLINLPGAYTPIYAQLGAINDMLYYGKFVSDYILFNDMDEFIYWNDSISLKDYICSNNKTCYAFQNQFIALINKNIQVKANIDNIEMIKNGKFDKLRAVSIFPSRSKCVVKSNDIKIMCVHSVNNPNYIEIMDNTCILDSWISGFYHVCNFQGRVRFGNME